MKNTICGIDCSKCSMSENCKGCEPTEGRPFGGKCVVAECCHSKGKDICSKCADAVCSLKGQLIEEFNALNVPNMPKVEELFALLGSFVNVEYTLDNGQKIKLLKDNDIYLGTQLEKSNCDRCYGLAADEKYLMVCEYGQNGADPEIVVFKRR